MKTVARELAQTGLISWENRSNGSNVIHNQLEIYTFFLEMEMLTTAWGQTSEHTEIALTVMRVQFISNEILYTGL